MRIGYLVGGLGRGGEELQLLQLCSGLGSRGHEVSVLAFDGPGALNGAFRDVGVNLHKEPAHTLNRKVRSVRT